MRSSISTLIPECFGFAVTKETGMLSDRKKAAQLLGSLGGKARAKSMTAAQRKAQATKAAKARWKKREGKVEGH